MTFLTMFVEFFKTGLFSIGGGLATLPFLQTIGEKYGWYNSTDLANMLAVSESTPGPIGVNMATYAGNTVGGILGGVVSTLGLILPSFLVILVVAKLMQKFSNNRFVQSSMSMLRPASVGMITAAIWGVLKEVLVNVPAILALDVAHAFQWISLVLFGILLAVYTKFPKLHPVVILAAGAVVGIALQL